jgi:hypothetical protein
MRFEECDVFRNSHNALQESPRPGLLRAERHGHRSSFIREARNRVRFSSAGKIVTSPERAFLRSGVRGGQSL